MKSFVNDRNRMNCIKSWKQFIVGLIFFTAAALLLSNCCKTVVKSGATLQKVDPNEARFGRANLGYEVWACPGTPVSIGWYVSEDVKAVTIDNGIGSVEIPGGLRIVSPTADTVYTIKATGGDCDVTTQISVKIIKPGTGGTVNVPFYPNSHTGWWETYLDKDFYDQNIIITSLMINRDDWTGKYGWILNKQDTNGALHKFGPIFSTPATLPGFPVQLAGKHQIEPSPQVVYLDWQAKPQILNETLTLDCKAQ